MNTQLNIKTWLQQLSPTFVTLLIGIVVAIVGGPSIQAQTAADAPVDSSITVAIKGTVNDPSGPINITGNVIVSCRRVVDTTSTTTPAIVMLDFDFSQVKGTSTTLKVVKTYITGDNHANEIRPLLASDTIIVTAPYFDAATKDELSARTMLISANLNFDVGTGKLTSGSMSVGNNNVTTQAVGTVSATDSAQPQ